MVFDCFNAFCCFSTKFQVPLALFGGAGNYASALYIAAVKVNALDTVESDILDFVEASKRSENFSQFIRNLSVPRDVRVKAITAICSESKFADVTKNFLGMISCSWSFYLLCLSKILFLGKIVFF